MALRANFHVLYHCTWADVETLDMMEDKRDASAGAPARADTGTAPARHPGAAGRRRIKPGYLADLLLVNGDPLQDITILQNRHRLHAIMKDDRFYKEPLFGAPLSNLK